MIQFISATQFTREEFEAKARLAKTLRAVASTGKFRAQIAFENKRGLPEIYNAAIERNADDDILLFVHDDVTVVDWHLATRLEEGLSRYDVIGLAGNKRRMPMQPAWHLRAPQPGDTKAEWDERSNLSGSIGNPTEKGMILSWFGELPAEVKLLDGVFLAARKKTLAQANARFDTRFMFHFYDLDFSRTCEQAGLRLGTWPIAVVHESTGAGGFGSPSWREALKLYRAKWGD